MPDDRQWGCRGRWQLCGYNPRRKAATNGKDVLECISTISAHLQHAAVEAEIRV